MAVTISAPKYFTGTGPIKFSEIRDTFGDLPGTNVRISDYKRNSDACVDWDEDNTITPRVPDATENAQLPDIDENIQLQDYRNTIREYDVTQTGSEEERVYTDGNEADWNNNLSKNVNKDYNVTGTIYGEGGAAGGGNGGGALYIKNTFICDKVTLSIANNGKIWAGGGGGIDGNAGKNPKAITCTETKAWNAKNAVGNTHLCNDKNNNGCNRPLAVCKANDADVGNLVNETNKNRASNKIVDSTVSWNKAINKGGNRGRCRHTDPKQGIGRGSINVGDVKNYADRQKGYQCTTKWEMVCYGDAEYTVNPVAGVNRGGNGGNGGSGKGFTNRNVAMNASPHKGNDGGAKGTCVKCPNTDTKSCGKAGNPGNSGGDWGQQGGSGGSGGIAIHRKGINLSGRSDDTVKGNVVSI